MFKRKKIKQEQELTSNKISWGHWFAFFNVIWVILIGSRYAFLSDWPSTLFGRVYFFISIIGHFSFIVLTFYLLIIFPLTFIIKNHRTFRGVVVLLSTLGIALLLFDTEVYKRFYIHSSSLVWDLLINPENGELARDWQLFFAPMPFILLLQMLFSRWSWQKLRSLQRQRWGKYVGVVCACAFIATHLIYAWADANFYRPITAQRANYPLSYPLTARGFLEKNNLLNHEEYQQNLVEKGRADALRINYPKKMLHYKKQLIADTNILFINISGLRYDAITSTTMPMTTQYLQSAVQFPHNYSSGNGVKSGNVGLLYGLSGNYFDNILVSQKPSALVQRLQMLGYPIYATTTQKSLLPLFKTAFKQAVTLEKNNQIALKKWLNWQQKQDKKPWFSWLNLELTTAMNEMLTASKTQKVAHYNELLTQLDQQIAQVFQQLEVTQQLANTFIVITADSGYSFDHNTTFTRDMIRVPLFVYWNKFIDIVPENQLTSNMDIIPTVMETLLGIENPTVDYALGTNLFSVKRNNWVLVANTNMNVIVVENGEQYQISDQGDYQKYDENYQPLNSKRPPFGLLLSVLSQTRSFMEK